jgi:hypothetical protein
MWYRKIGGGGGGGRKNLKIKNKLNNNFFKFNNFYF